MSCCALGVLGVAVRSTIMRKYKGVCKLRAAFGENPCTLPHLRRSQVEGLTVRLRRGALLPGLLTSPYGLVVTAAATLAWGPRLWSALLAAAAAPWRSVG